MFNGEGFVRGILGKGRVLAGARVLVVGAAASALRLWRRWPGWRGGACTVRRLCCDNERLAERLRACYPALKIEVGSRIRPGSMLSSTPRPLA
jgi:shikimate dehydrogenase